MSQNTGVVNSGGTVVMNGCAVGANAKVVVVAQERKDDRKEKKS